MIAGGNVVNVIKDGASVQYNCSEEPQTPADLLNPKKCRLIGPIGVPDGGAAPELPSLQAKELTSEETELWEKFRKSGVDSTYFYRFAPTKDTYDKSDFAQYVLPTLDGVDEKLIRSMAVAKSYDCGLFCSDSEYDEAAENLYSPGPVRARILSDGFCTEVIDGLAEAAHQAYSSWFTDNDHGDTATLAMHVLSHLCTINECHQPVAAQPPVKQAEAPPKKEAVSAVANKGKKALPVAKPAPEAAKGKAKGAAVPEKPAKSGGDIPTIIELP